MKRAVVVLVAFTLGFGLTAAPADKPVAFKVRNVLDRAVQNEREAVARYEAFAIRATEEGCSGAACLFRAAARAERVHVARFEKAMRQRGVPIPDPSGHDVKVGSTAENLRAAAAAETAERDGLYREAIAAAGEASDQELALIFDQTRDTEVEHANLLHAAARQLEQMRGKKDFYVCDDCGYTSELDLPLCALCRTRHAPHKIE